MKKHALNPQNAAQTLCKIVATADNVATQPEEVDCKTCLKALENMIDQNNITMPAPPPVIVSAIAKKALLCRVTIGLPPQTKLDKKTSAEVAEAKGADSRVVRVTKHLFDPASYAKLMAAMDKIRNYYYFRTLPWSDGVRIISVDAYASFTAKMRELRTEWDKTREEFCANYAKELELAQEMLTDNLFDLADYPSEHEIASRFRFDVTFFPIPLDSDFRVELDQTDIDLIKQDMEKDVAKTFRASMTAVWERLYEALASDDSAKPGLIKKLQSERVSQASLDAMTRLLDLLPTLNITNDPTMEKMAQELREVVLSKTAESLRSDENLRNSTALEAEKIAKRMKGYMSAFGD